MELEKTLEQINKDRERIEACFVFSLWKNPELYSDYLQLNEGKDKTLTNEDAQFYFSLGKSMFKQGYKTFDCVTLETFLENKPEIKKKYDRFGGYKEIESIRSTVSADNIDANFDKILRMNVLSSIATKYDKVFDDVKRFDNASAEEVYEVFELLNNSVAISSTHKEKIESLEITDDFIADLESGENVGFNYGKYNPMLNYITLGCPDSSLYMIAGHSGTGKSSFAFGSILLGLHHAGVSSAVISNEMKSKNYKILLLVHVLTKELDYWGLTRKQIKIGNFTPEQKEKIKEAKEIIKNKYSDIKFIKMFDNDISKIMKYLKILKAMGKQVVLYDTFKSDDNVDSSTIWQSLMLDARKLFQCASKLGMCVITTYQLALHTTNQRFLDAGCLSNSKQIKEVYETMVYTRPLWDDEYTGEKYDVKAYKLNKDNNKIKEPITLDKEKKYMLLFIDKTRSDDDKQVLIYEWNARFNNWKELGFARVKNDHRSV